MPCQVSSSVLPVVHWRLLAKKWIGLHHFVIAFCPKRGCNFHYIHVLSGKSIHALFTNLWFYTNVHGNWNFEYTLTLHGGKSRSWYRSCNYSGLIVFCSAMYHCKNWRLHELTLKMSSQLQSGFNQVWVMVHLLMPWFSVIPVVQWRFLATNELGCIIFWLHFVPKGGVTFTVFMYYWMDSEKYSCTID